MPFFAHANFNPRAPYGARLSRRPWARWPPHFNPRAPYGARRPDRWRSCGPAYFNPRAPYGARLQVQILIRTDKIISIHAPHTGRDWLMVPGILYTWEFQSTRPIRGATVVWPIMRVSVVNFNPRAPYGARLTEFFVNIKSLRISIHAPHTGRDIQRRIPQPEHFSISIHAPHTGRDKPQKEFSQKGSQFQSTRPIRGATYRL